jgi:ACT domain-containing protein
VRGALSRLVDHIDALDEAILAIDQELAASVKADATAKRLTTIPGELDPIGGTTGGWI